MIADVRSELSAELELADQDAARAVARADAMHTLVELAWSIEATGPTVELDDVTRRLTGVDRARWLAAIDVAARTLPDTD